MSEQNSEIKKLKPKRLTLVYIILMGFFLFIIIESLRIGDGYYLSGTVKFIVLMTVFYLFAHKINMNVTIFTGIGFSMVLHSMGRFGFFDKTVLGIPWDVLTHFISSYFTALAVFKFLERSNLAYGWKIFFTLFTCIGIATIGEFLEFFGATQTPHGRGLLGTEAKASPIPWLSPDYWDTMKDLVMNAFGTSIGVLTWIIYNKFKKKASD